MPSVMDDDSDAAVVAIYATLMYDVISATNSSPQTTEINAEARADTLMKWVNIGLLQGAAFVMLGVLLDKKRWRPILGGGMAAILLWLQYRHALQSGLENGGATTETYDRSN